MPTYNQQKIPHQFLKTELKILIDNLKTIYTKFMHAKL